MKMNRFLGMTLGLILSATALTGCSSNGESTSGAGTKENIEVGKSPVLVKEIEFVDAKILEPDSVGQRYFETKFKNNSSKTITSISVELELNDGEIAYLTSSDTIKPGETSSKTECFAPSTGNKEDMKAKTISIIAIDGDKQLYIDYDVKLDKYDVLEGEIEESKIDTPVSIKDIEFVDAKILEPDSIGQRYYEARFKNNSKVPITSVSIELELDNGEVAYLTSHDTLLPGDTSSKTECFAPSTGNEEDMKAKKISIISLNKDNKEVYIDYDVKLDKYDIMESAE